MILNELTTTKLWTGKMIELAQLHSLESTWKDSKIVDDARQRLEAVINHKPAVEQNFDFEFIIDDHSTYHHLTDFKSPKAKQLYLKYEQMEKDYRQQTGKLKSQREGFARSNKDEQVNGTGYPRS